MSGPKINRYTLSASQKAALQAQIRRRREQIEKERLKREQERERQRQEKKMIDAKRAELSSLKTSVERLEVTLSGLRELSNQAKGVVDVSGISDMIKSAQQSAETLLSHINHGVSLSSMHSIEEIVTRTTNDYSGLRDYIQQIEYEGVQISGLLQDKLSEDIAAFFSEPSNATGSEKQSSIQVKISSAQSALQNLLDYDCLPLTQKTEIRRALEKLEWVSAENADSYIEIEVQPLIKRGQKYVTLWEKNGEEYKTLLIQYESLVTMNHREDRIQAVPFDDSAVIQLEKLIAAEEQIALESAEREYISETLAEVMQEMGYAVWGNREVKKRNGKRLSKSLFHYGDGMAIDITCADDGQITMELGAVDTSDRLPSQKETSLLVSEMESFCEDFSVIETKLAAHGVVVGHRISLAPPSKEYAQVINIGDYTVSGASDSPAERIITNKKRHLKAVEE